MLVAEYTIPGLGVREHVQSVPLDWDATDGETIEVFVREVVAPERAHEDLPLLLFLQGGPGGRSPRPVAADGWLGVALERFRVVLLDQRGTGRSSRVDGARMRRFPDGTAGAAFLERFRADSIVRDAEHIRRTVYGGRRWSTLGQSYGGFLTLTYLSFAPEALAACYVTGGLAAVRPDAAEVYRRTFPRALAKNRGYRSRYPHDVAAVGRIADRLAVGDVVLPDGDALTVRRFQFAGSGFGMRHGYEDMHWLVEEAFPPGSDDLADPFLAEVQRGTDFTGNELWAALQELCYVDQESGAPGWAAEAERARHPEFAEDARPLQFTGEAMFPWMFDEIRLLRPFAAAAEVLARRTDWSPIYDRARLAANEVPVAAAVYFDDLYVDAGLQLDTAAAVGGVHPWVTNEHEHDGLRQDPEVLRHLLRTVDELGGPIRG